MYRTGLERCGSVAMLGQNCTPLAHRASGSLEQCNCFAEMTFRKVPSVTYSGLNSLAEELQTGQRRT